MTQRLLLAFNFNYGPAQRGQAGVVRNLFIYTLHFIGGLLVTSSAWGRDMGLLIDCLSRLQSIATERIVISPVANHAKFDGRGLIPTLYLLPSTAFLIEGLEVYIFVSGNPISFMTRVPAITGSVAFQLPGAPGLVTCLQIGIERAVMDPSGQACEGLTPLRLNPIDEAGRVYPERRLQNAALSLLESLESFYIGAGGILDGKTEQLRQTPNPAKYSLRRELEPGPDYLDRFERFAAQARVCSEQIHALNLSLANRFLDLGRRTEIRLNRLSH